MASTPKVLGQSTTPPTAGVLYTVPTTALGAVTSTLLLCNTGTVSCYVTVRVAVGGAVDSPTQTVYDQVEVTPHDTFAATIGMTLTVGDVVRVFGTTALVNATLFGTEVS